MLSISATTIRVVGLLLNTPWAWSGLAAVAGRFVSGPEVDRRHAMLPPLAGATVLLAATASYDIVDVLIDDPARQRSLLVMWLLLVSATAVVIAGLRRSPTS